MAEIVSPDTEETQSKMFTAVQLSDGQAAFIAERTGELTVFPGSSAFG
ncbi:MAG: hypothetical protein ABR534_04640 [Desulfotignum sp.]|nr:hypothetical protein [Desulfobacteraceae bacterium]